MSGDEYTRNPTHVRIIEAYPGDEYPWQVDAADDEGRYTEEVWTFTTHAECVRHLPEFIETVEDMRGAPIEWRKRQMCAWCDKVATRNRNHPTDACCAAHHRKWFPLGAEQVDGGFSLGGVPFYTEPATVEPA